MAKAHRKVNKPCPSRRWGAVKELRVVRSLHEPIRVGLSPADPFRPQSIWRADGAVQPVTRVMKRWTDEYSRRWYRVRTESGLYDLYEHRHRFAPLAQGKGSVWFLAAELELVPAKRLS